MKRSGDLKDKLTAETRSRGEIFQQRLRRGVAAHSRQKNLPSAALRLLVRTV